MDSISKTLCIHVLACFHLQFCKCLKLCFCVCISVFLWSLIVPFECFCDFSCLWLAYFQTLCYHSSMAPKKRVKTTAASTSQAPAGPSNSSLPYVINKYDTIFVDSEHASRYDTIVIRKLSAPSYLDRYILDIVSLYDDLRRLLGILG